MKKVAIVHYNLNRKGGSQTVAVNIANELVNSFDVSLISLKSDITNDFKLDERIHCLKLKKSNTLLDGFNLNKLLKKHKIEVLLIMGTGAGYCLPFISKSIKVIVSEQSNCLNKVYMASRKTRLNHSLAAKRADRVVCLTEQDKMAWIQKYGLKESKMAVIHNYVVPEDISKDRENKIITVGSFDPVKGYDFLLEVASKVCRATDYTWHLYAMGENEYKQEFMKQLEQENIPNFVVEKPVPDVSGIYASSKIHVLTSRNEGLPLSLIEAKLYGCVNVAFDCVTGPNEIIRDNIDGYLVDCYDTDQMAQKILSLINDQTKLVSFSEAGILDKDRFSKEQVIESWVNVIQSVI